MTNLSIRTFDLPTLAQQIHRHSIGFDRMFDTLNQTFANSKIDSNYPPYDLVKTGDETYEISLAVAGFAQGEIDVTFQDNMLTVTGEKSVLKMSARGIALIFAFLITVKAKVVCCS